MSSDESLSLCRYYKVSNYLKPDSRWIPRVIGFLGQVCLMSGRMGGGQEWRPKPTFSQHLVWPGILCSITVTDTRPCETVVLPMSCPGDNPCPEITQETSLVLVTSWQVLRHLGCAIVDMQMRSMLPKSVLTLTDNSHKNNVCLFVC